MLDNVARVDHCIRVFRRVTHVLCTRPYPDHPKGCPNFGKKSGCPPHAPNLWDIIQLGKPVWAIWNVFPLLHHVIRMRRHHPDWSDRQLRNPRHWQGTARKRLRKRIELFRSHHAGLVVLDCPEAHGVLVTDMMLGLGIELKWPPEAVTYQVAVAGAPVAV